MSRRRVELHPLGNARAFQDLVLVLMSEGKSLRQLLAAAPALSLAPLDPELLDAPLDRLVIKTMHVDPRTPLYRADVASEAPGEPAGAHASGHAGDSAAPAMQRDAAAADALPRAPIAAPITAPAAAPIATSGAAAAPDLVQRPLALSDDEAVGIAHAEDIEQIASYLRAGLSVLVFCDKLVVRHLWPRIVRAAGRDPLELELPGALEAPGLVPQSLRQRQLDLLRDLLADMKHGQVLVLPYLDLLGGGGERSLTPEARALAELLYEWPDRLLLAFADRSLPLAPVIAERFAIRPEIRGVPRDVPGPAHAPAGASARILLGDALVTRDEAAHFADYDPRALFKNVAGMNPLRLRHAIAYAVEQAQAHGHAPASPAPASLLHAAIRTFKVQTSAQFEIPRVTMEDIGGYDQVKAVLERALSLMAGAWKLPDEALRNELIPRGFLLHGPPGTGKTLFARAVAHRLNATIRVVSGPEVTDKYVGESERNVREIFAEARRNAPSVVVFDEFDAIAASRTGRDDGGSRAGNAMVAQILTEMDGFRPDVPMLVIGTTNRLELIDEALLRTSRFQPIAVGLPDRAARRQIATIHARHFHLDADPALLDLVADQTEGMNGDQIRSVFRDACLGLHCQDPPVPVTPARLASLIAVMPVHRSGLRADPRARDGVHSENRGRAPDPGPPAPARAD
jgi:transitional endoplasmic reticulum ATPase